MARPCFVKKMKNDVKSPDPYAMMSFEIEGR
jgi:hypothetical protein